MFLSFFSHKYVDRSPRKVPFLTDLVLKIAAIGFLYPLGKVAEENECRDYRFLKHGHILDLDILALVGGWRIGSDYLLHIGVELGR